MSQDAGVQLQPGITVVRDGAGTPLALEDALLGRTITLRPTAAALVARVDGSRSWTALVDEVAAVTGARDDVEDRLRSLMCLNVLRGCGDDVRRQIARVKAAPDRGGHVVLPGARFQCQGSGACCENYRLGPLSTADQRLMETLRQAAAFPRDPHLPAVVEHFSGHGKLALYLPTDENHCAFLAGDKRCRLHGTFGATQKPGFCRLYPLDVLPTMEGVKFFDRGTCASFAVSSNRGDLLADQLALCADILPRDQEFYHPIVFFEDHPLDYGHFLRLLSLLQRVASHGGFPSVERLVAVTRALLSGVGALRRMPLASSQPDDTINDLLQPGPARWFASSPDPSGADLRLALVEDLCEFVGEPLLGSLLPTHRVLTHALARELSPTLEALRGCTPGAPLSTEMDQALQRSLQQHLFGSHALLMDRAVPALLRLGVVHLLAVTHARQGAAGGEALEWFSRGHMLAMRVLEGADSIFLRHERHALAILSTLPGLVGPPAGHS